MKWLNRSLILSPVYFGLCANEKAFKKQMKKFDIPPGSIDWINEGHEATTHFFQQKGIDAAIVCINILPEHTKGNK